MSLIREIVPKFGTTKGSALEFKILPDLTHKNQFLRYRAHHLAVAFMGSTFGHNFQGRHAGGILPNPIHGILPSQKLVPPTSFNWQTNILLQGENSPALLAMRIYLSCQPWSSCKKNLESIKCQFLNSPPLYLTPYSNKD